jgi:hypothetical protein
MPDMPRMTSKTIIYLQHLEVYAQVRYLMKIIKLKRDNGFTRGIGMKRRKNLYLDQETAAILAEMEQETGKKSSILVSEALYYMRHRDNMIRAFVNEIIAQQNEELRKILREELDK